MVLYIDYDPEIAKEDEDCFDKNVSMVFNKLYLTITDLSDLTPRNLLNYKKNILCEAKEYCFYLRNEKNSLKNGNQEDISDIQQELNEVKTFSNQLKNTNDILSSFCWMEVDFENKEDFPAVLNALRFPSPIPKVVSLRNFDSEEVLDLLINLDDEMIPEGVLFLHRYNLTQEQAKETLTASSKNDLVFALQKMKSLADQIDSFSLTPIEKMMVAYDLIRDREYKEVPDVSDPEQYCLSRDFVQILKKEDFIVCLGYASLIQVLFDFLHIKSNCVFLHQKNNKTIGHARNLVLVDDPDYHLHFVSFLDATFASRRGDNRYLNLYGTFLRGQHFFSQKYPQEVSSYSCFNYHDYRKMVNELEESDILPNDEKIRSIRSSIHAIYALLGEQDQIPYNQVDGAKKFQLYQDPKIFLDLYRQTIEKLNFQLSKENFIRCFYKVRRVEHYLDPEKYPLSLSTVETASIGKKNPSSSFENELMRIFFGINREKTAREIVNHLDVVSCIPGNYKLEKDEKRIHFLHEIRTLSDNLSDCPPEMTVGEIMKIKRKRI